MSGTSSAGVPALVLVGPPGVGKSTVAREVAAALAVELVDTDAEVERALDRPIAEIFVEEGESVFRQAEAVAVGEALGRDGAVVCLGGGAVMTAAVDADVAAAAERGARVVFLDVGVADAARRIGLNQSRPLLAVNPRASWIAMMAERRPTYERLATDTVDTAQRGVDDVVDDVLALLGAQPGERP